MWSVWMCFADKNVPGEFNLPRQPSTVETVRTKSNKVTTGDTNKTLKVLSKMDLVRALNDFSFDDRGRWKKKEVLKFCYKHQISEPDIKQLERVPESYFNTLGGLCKLVNQNIQLPEKYTVEYIKKLIVPLASKATEKSDKSTSTSTISFSNASILFDSIDGRIETFIKTGKKIEPVDLTPYDTKDIVQVNKWSGQCWKNEITHIDRALNKEDCYAEAYSHLSKKQLVYYKNFLEGIVNQIETRLDNEPEVVKKTRKPRKPKPLDYDKALEDFVYLSESDGVQSINPKDIFKSTELYIFDVRRYTLIHLVAEDNKKLIVRGHCIRNLNPEKSVGKKVNPKHFGTTFGSLINSSKTNCYKIFTSISSKEYLHSGRITEHCLIFKRF